MTPINVILWDCGHWGGKGGFSQPRILSAVRNLELTGQLRISEMRYVKTDSELSKRLPHEPTSAYNFREAERHKIQKSRVKQTIDFFGYKNKKKDYEENLENLHPITPDGKLLFIVICPPGNERTRLLEQLLRLDMEAALVIAPAVWTNTVELELIIAETIRNKTRVVPVPFVPYRYSESMRVLGEKKDEGKAVEILSAEVLSGRYPKIGRVGFRAFISEFAAPIIDSFLHAADSPIETGSIIYKEAQGQSPCILINAVHQNTVVSVMNISAISKFQLVNLTGTAFFAGERLNFTDAFRDTVFYDADGVIKSSEASRGHDARVEDRNGYAELLSNIINNKDLPTLESYRNTQAFIDRIYAALTEMQKQQKLQTHL